MLKPLYATELLSYGIIKRCIEVLYVVVNSKTNIAALKLKFLSWKWVIKKINVKGCMQHLCTFYKITLETFVLGIEMLNTPLNLFVLFIMLFVKIKLSN